MCLNTILYVGETWSYSCIKVKQINWWIDKINIMKNDKDNLRLDFVLNFFGGGFCT